MFITCTFSSSASLYVLTTWGLGILVGGVSGNIAGLSIKVSSILLSNSFAFLGNLSKVALLLESNPRVLPMRGMKSSSLSNANCSDFSNGILKLYKNHGLRIKEMKESFKNFVDKIFEF